MVFKMKEMTTDKKIKNLQVSISIARKEIKTKLELMKSTTDAEKIKLITRIAICEKIISVKEEQLTPLKELWNKEKPQRATTQTATQEEINEVMKKYNIG